MMRGFTLIELLVAIVIISIIVTMGALAIGEPGAEKLREESRRLSALLKLSQEEAILQSRELGIGFWENGYEFFELFEGQWVAIEQDQLFRARELPEDMELQLTLEGLDIVMSAVQTDKPQVFILSSGEVSPFDLRFTWKSDRRLTLSSDALGKLELAGAED